MVWVHNGSRKNKMGEIIGFLEKRELSILERKPTSKRMRERDEAGKKLRHPIRRQNEYNTP